MRILSFHFSGITRTGRLAGVATVNPLPHLRPDIHGDIIGWSAGLHGCAKRIKGNTSARIKPERFVQRFGGAGVDTLAAIGRTFVFQRRSVILQFGVNNYGINNDKRTAVFGKGEVIAAKVGSAGTGPGPAGRQQRA